MSNKTLSSASQCELINTLKVRFENNPQRHSGFVWSDIEKILTANPQKLRSLYQMEVSGGEPDVVGDCPKGNIVFVDCSKESPLYRRSLCYDRNALDSRKSNPPVDNVMDVVALMGVELLTEEDYLWLQTFGEFDLKSSSWLKTPTEIRSLGGAIFGDRRYNRVFIYHNGAESYYSSRGFRTILKI